MTILIMHFFLFYVLCLSIIIVAIIITITFSDPQRLGGQNKFETNNKLNRFIRENSSTF